MDVENLQKAFESPNEIKADIIEQHFSAESKKTSEVTLNQYLVGNDREVLACDSAQRGNTVEICIQQLRSELAFYRDKWSEAESDQKTVYREHIDRCEQLLNRMKMVTGEWLSTSGPHYLFQGSLEEIEEKVGNLYKELDGMESSLRKLKRGPDYKDQEASLSTSIKTLKQTIQNVKKNSREQALLLTKTKDIPLLGNLYHQNVSIRQEQGDRSVLQFNRSAAITDFSHNETNLREMVDYPLLLQFRNEFLAATPEQKVLLDRYDIRGNGDKVSPKKLEKVLTRIENRIQRGYPELRSMDFSEVEKAAVGRRTHLQAKVMQDLFLHLKQGQVAFDGENMVYARLSLLNTFKQPNVNRSGLVLSEVNQALDMAAVLEMMDGAEVHFDQKDEEACFIDQMTGNLHLSKSFALDVAGSEEIRQIRLKTFIFDVSVQGNISNKGVQKQINDVNFDRLRDYVKSLDQPLLFQRFEKVENAMQNEEGFELASSLALFLKEIASLSINCYGGKDRTGYLAALISFEALFDQTAPEERRLGSHLKDHIARQLMSDEGILAQIIKASTGRVALKVLPINLKLYYGDSVKNKISGVGRRVLGYGRAAFLKVRGEKKSQVDENVIRTFQSYHF